jgi:predicted nucleic acid-binding protein
MLINKVIISDTSCLIALDRIQHLHILQQLFSTISTTIEVAAEFGEPLPAWIEIKSVQNHSKIKELEFLIDKGEASAIALALETPNCTLIIDEKLGRKVAKELSISIIGTLKILLLAKQRGTIQSVKELLILLEKKNFRFSKNIVDTILHEAGEHL